MITMTDYPKTMQGVETTKLLAPQPRQVAVASQRTPQRHLPRRPIARYAGRFLIGVTIGLALLWSGSRAAAQPVSIADTNLEAAVRQQLGKPAGVLMVADMLSLTNLSANSRSVRDLSGLQTATNLVFLEAGWQGGQLANVGLLSNLVNLTHLGLEASGVMDASFARPLNKLSHLGLYANTVRDVSPVAGLTNLTFLHLGWNQTTNLQVLSGLTRLTLLGLAGNSLTNVSFMYGMAELQTIGLDNNQLTTFPMLSFWPRINSLNLDNNPFGTVPAAAAAGPTNLQQLVLRNCQITGLAFITNLPKLTSFLFDGNRATDITPLLALTNLTDLSISGNRLTNMTSLLGLPGLLSVDVRNNFLDISDGSLALAQITVLTTRGVSVLYTPQNSLAVPYTYTTDHDTITITGYTGPGGAVAIPGTIFGLPVTGIGSFAFNGKSSVTSVSIPNSLTNISDNAFSFCLNMTNVTLGNGVTSIGAWAFSGCMSLTDISIPNQVASIGDGAFSFCPKLIAITVAALNPAYSDVAGVLFNKSQTTLIQFPGGKPGSSYTVPYGVTSIGFRAFYNQATLTSVLIPDSVTTIESDVFRYCYNMTTMRIGAGVTSIGSNAFAGCTSLTQIYFKGNAPSLGADVFLDDSSATVYYLPGTTGWYTPFGGRPAVPTPDLLLGLADALNATNLTWATSGDANWFAQSDANHDGVSAATSGAITDSQTSTLETTVTGPGTLSFWWQVSSESGYDYLELYTNNVLANRISGEMAWQVQNYTLAAGSQTLRWRYMKDSSVSSGQDRGWLDQVGFQPDSGTPVITIQPASLWANAGNSVSFACSATCAAPLRYQWWRANVPILAATNAALTLTNIQPAQAGGYCVVITNQFGATTSSVAQLTVGLPAPDALTEGTAGLWYADAQYATATVADDPTRVKTGVNSLRFSTSGGFDTWIGTPHNHAAGLNLATSDIRGLAFWIYAENTNTSGFQNSSPWIRLHTSTNSYLELHARSELMNACRGQWVRFIVPFEGDNNWTVISTGSPSLANINWLEFHADTWGGGFRYWLDGFEFTTIPILSLRLELTSLRLWTGYRWMNNRLLATSDSGEIEVSNAKAVWSSSNPSIVAVDTNGVLEALAAGTATITARYRSNTTTMTVEVLNAEPPVYESIPAALATPATNALFDVPVLIFRFLPTLDGVNLDVAQARDFWSPGETTITALKQQIDLYDRRAKWMIEEGSRFRGYQNPAAKPSLGVRVVGYITVYEQNPPGLSRQRDAVGAPMSEVDYERLFQRFNVAHYVNDLGVKEIWIWNGSIDGSFPSYDPATCRPEYRRSLPESNMSSPLTGDISNSYRWDDLPVYNTTYVVYSQNFRRTQAEAIHNRGHQLEATLSYVDWLRNGSSSFFWDRFCGRNPDGSFAPGRAGNCHYPPNAASDYDYLNTRLISSDCEDWTPDNSGAKKPVNASTWGTLSYAWPQPQTAVAQQTESQYYLYWFQNMPGRQNHIAFGAQGLANWWVFTGDWDNAIRSGLGLYGARATNNAALPALQLNRLPDRSRLTTPYQPGCLYRLWRSTELGTWWMPPSQSWYRGGGNLILDDLSPADPAAFYRLSGTVIVEP